MKQLLTILIIMVSFFGNSQTRIRNGAWIIQNNDTVYITYSNGGWNIFSDTTFNGKYDTLEVGYLMQNGLPYTVDSASYADTSGFSNVSKNADTANYYNLRSYDTIIVDTTFNITTSNDLSFHVKPNGGDILINLPEPWLVKEAIRVSFILIETGQFTITTLGDTTTIGNDGLTAQIVSTEESGITLEASPERWALVQDSRPKQTIVSNIFYWESEISDIAGYRNMTTIFDSLDTRTLIPYSITGTDQLLEEWVSDSLIFDGLVPSNNFTISIEAYQDLNTNSTATIYSELYIRDNLGVENLISTTNISGNLSIISLETIILSGIYSEFTGAKSDRIVCKLYSSKTGPSNPGIQVGVEGTTPTRLNLSLPTVRSIIEAAGNNNEVQYNLSGDIFGANNLKYYVDSTVTNNLVANTVKAKDSIYVNGKWHDNILDSNDVQTNYDADTARQTIDSDISERMKTSVYDIDNDSIVDNSELLQGVDTTYLLNRSHQTGNLTTDTTFSNVIQPKSGGEVKIEASSDVYVTSPLDVYLEVNDGDGYEVIDIYDDAIRLLVQQNSQYEFYEDSAWFEKKLRIPIIGIDTLLLKNDTITGITKINDTTLQVIVNSDTIIVGSGGGSGGDATTLNGEAGSYYLSRTNHTGTQEISTITDLQDSLSSKLDSLYISGQGWVRTKNDTINIPDTVKVSNISASEILYKKEKYTVGVRNEYDKNIVIIGDSRIKPLRGLTKFINTFDIPLGYTAFLGDGTYGDDYKIIALGTDYLLQGQSDLEIGIDGQVTKMLTGGYVHVTLDSSSAGNKLTDLRRTCNRIIIYYAIFDNAGEFRYRQDGGIWDTVDCQNSTDSLGYLVLDYEYQIDDLEFDIELVSDSVYLYGFESDILFDDKKDKMLVSILATGGLSLREYNEYSKIWQDYIEYRKPSQIHISFGSNDFAENRTVSEYMSDIRNVVDKCTLDTFVNYVLYTQYDIGVGAPKFDSTDAAYVPWYENQSDSLYAYAFKTGYSVFDWRKKIGNAKNIYEAGFTNDGVHINGDGDLYTLLELKNVLTPYHFSNSLFNKYNHNFSTKGISVLQSDNVYGVNNEYPRFGGYRLSATGTPINTWSLYSPNQTRLYLNIGATNLFQWRTTGNYSVVNFGIKDSSPSYDLDVNGTIRAVEDVYISTSTYGVVIKAPDNSCWRITVDNSGTLSTTSITCP